jgi:hypothetical protein
MEDKRRHHADIFIVDNEKNSTQQNNDTGFTFI